MIRLGIAAWRPTFQTQRAKRQADPTFFEITKKSRLSTLNAMEGCARWLSAELVKVVEDCTGGGYALNVSKLSR